MILVDTGPLVALFDPRDEAHARCVEELKVISEPIATTIPVLTEAVHLLQPGSIGTQRLIDFITGGGIEVLFLDDQLLERALKLMAQYRDAPMDLADASLVAVAESRNLRTIFTIDRKDFAIYRIKRGRRYFALGVIG